MPTTVVGLFDSATAAQAAVQDLTGLGVSRDQISIVAKRDGATAASTGTIATANDRTEGAEGAGIGAAAGGVAGAAAGILASLGLLAIPGIGWLLAAGPLVATLTGAGVGAATGAIIGGLIGLGIPERDAELYEEGVNRGGTLVTAHVDDALAQTAADSLARHGAVDIDRQAEAWRASGWSSRYDTNAGVAGVTGTAGNAGAPTSAAASSAASAAGRGLGDATSTGATGGAGTSPARRADDRSNPGSMNSRGTTARIYTRDNV
jgi:hypothetical protein